MKKRLPDRALVLPGPSAADLSGLLRRASPVLLVVGAWLLCRGGARSVRFVSRVEAVMLLGTAAVSAVTSRLLLPELVHRLDAWITRLRVEGPGPVEAAFRRRAIAG